MMFPVLHSLYHHNNGELLSPLYNGTHTLPDYEIARFFEALCAVSTSDGIP
jgi:hypothetical protein